MGNNKDWDDVPYVTGDCVRDTDEWNDMVDYIRHSSCTDFTIYSACPLTGQAFRFTQDNTDSQMFGGDDIGDDLHIWGNDNAGAVNIALLNTGEFKLFDGATEELQITYAANVTTIEGGAVSGDDLVLKGSSANPYAKIVLKGNGSIDMYHANANVVNFYEHTTAYGYVKEDTQFSIGSQGNRDIFLVPHGSGLVKFGTYAASTITHTGYITMKDASGTERLVMIGEV